MKPALNNDTELIFAVDAKYRNLDRGTLAVIKLVDGIRRNNKNTLDLIVMISYSWSGHGNFQRTIISLPIFHFCVGSSHFLLLCIQFANRANYDYMHNGRMKPQNVISAVCCFRKSFGQWKRQTRHELWDTRHEEDRSLRCVPPIRWK